MLKVINTADPLKHAQGSHAPEKRVAPQADLPRDRILIKGLVLPAFIGVFEREYEAPQNVQFDISVDMAPLTGDADYDLNNIVRYDYIVADIKALLAKGHVDLVETLAEDVAQIVLAYPRAEQVTVCVVKPEAFDEAFGVGVEITRA